VTAIGSALLAVLAVLSAEPSSAVGDERRLLTCVEWWPEARYSGTGYDHWVHLQSSCSEQALCHVVTDVNPDVLVAAIDPGQHVAVLTWRGSPAYEFTAAVECRRAGGG